MLPPIHLINLDRDGERLQRFTARNRHLANVTRISAADGTALDREKLVRAGTISPDFGCATGSLGCAVSHVRLWQQAVREDRPITVLEDDAVTVHGIEGAAAAVMSALPRDWDFIKWGWTANITAWLDIGLSRISVTGDGKPPLYDAQTLEAFQARSIAPAPVRMLHSFGLFAYSISPKGARAALDFCLPLRNRTIDYACTGTNAEAKGIDAMIWGAYFAMQAFLCMPNLGAHADEGRSIRIAMDRGRA